jgi:hypothetical protein
VCLSRRCRSTVINTEDAMGAAEVADRACREPTLASAGRICRIPIVMCRSQVTRSRRMSRDKAGAMRELKGPSSSRSRRWITSRPRVGSV